MSPDFITRRRALGGMLSAGGLHCALAAAPELPIRLAISESTVGDVNLNDIRVALRVWVDRISADANITVDSKLFSTIQEIIDRLRRNDLDMVALNILEYRQMVNLLDPAQLVTSADTAGRNQYVILARRADQVKRLSDLKGRRFTLMKNSRACLAPAWLATILDAEHCPPPEQFFRSIVTEPKVARVVLPVFFGQSDCCLTSRNGFSTMSVMNPQIGRDLEVVANSPDLVLQFYMFRKNYPDARKQKLLNAILHLRNGAGGSQLAELFQFDQLRVTDTSSLAGTLHILELADRARARQGGGERK